MPAGASAILVSVTEDVEPLLFKAARWLTISSAVLVLLSIAASQILLALAMVALLLSGQRLRVPRIWLPLMLFLAGTLVSLFLSGDVAAGLPQIRKFFVFLTLVAVYSTLRSSKDVRLLCYGWFGAGAVIALRGCVQFFSKMQSARGAGRGFYESYVADRITGFMSHWMTFSGEEMIVFLMLLSWVLFGSKESSRRPLWLACLGLVGTAVFLGWTRSVWLGSAAGASYLLAGKRRWAIAILPVLLLVALVVFPDRTASLLRPAGMDSNAHRMVTWRTGVNMIRQHPVWGLGPEQVGRQFLDFVPPNVPRPLPVGWYGHLHNIYLHYAAERGVPTMCMLIWLIVQAALDFRAGITHASGEARFILHGAIAVAIAAMVEGLFELNLGDSEVLAIFLAVIASGYVVLDQLRRSSATNLARMSA